jgi:hypothetical protein
VPRGQLRLSFRELTAKAQRAAELHSGGLSYAKIAAEMEVAYTTARRWVRWHEDMRAAYNGMKPSRAQRLPLRWGRAWYEWGEAEYLRLVAERQRIGPMVEARERLASQRKAQAAREAAARDAVRARTKEAAEWVEAGSPPERAPAWLAESILPPEKISPPAPPEGTPPVRPR